MERTVRKAISKKVVKVTEELELLVSIDIGMHNVKAVFRDLEGIFKTLIMSSEIEKGESLTSYTTTIDGEKWNLSEGGDAKVKVCEYDKVFTKATKYHQVLLRRMLYKIHLEVSPKYKKFDVIVGASVDNFSTTRGEDVVKEIGTGTFVISEGEQEEVELEITNVVAQPETASSILGGLLTKLKERNLYLCDLGGLNNTVFVVREGKIQFDTKGVEVDIKGMNYILGHIVAYYNRHNLEAKIDRNRVDYILRKKVATDRDKELIQGAVNEYMDTEFMPKLKTRGFNQAYGDSIEFIGGGAQVLKEYLEKYCADKNIECKIAKDTLFTSAKGMLRKVELERKITIPKGVPTTKK